MLHHAGITTSRNLKPYLFLKGIENIDNFLIVPDNFDKSKGIFYKLIPSEKFSGNSFVLVPYVNPMEEKMAPRFFSIKEKGNFSFQNTEEKETSSGILMKPDISKNEYIQKVKALKQHIQLGNIYEINFCFEFRAENAEINPVHVFQKLFQITKAPYSCLVKLGDEFILSGSPELDVL